LICVVDRRETAVKAEKRMAISKQEFLVIPLFLIGFSALPRAAGSYVTPTTTELSVSPQDVDVGGSVLVRAKVSVGATPVQHGSVMFCDANALRCEGSALFGSAQLTKSGTASVRLTLSAGSYSIKAVFVGTPRTVPRVSGSSSGPQALTVTFKAKARR